MFGIFCRKANYNSAMNMVWAAITIISLATLTVTNPQSVVSVCVDSGTQALKTALELCGVYCLWLGIFNVAEDCKLVEKLAKKLQPLNKVLYGKLPVEASEYISLNFASNLLGVGNAATPSAVEALKRTEKGEKLSFAGTVLFVVNASGVQLIPTTVVGLRASLGSSNAADIVFPNFLATLLTCAMGIALVLLCWGVKRNKRGEKKLPTKKPFAQQGAQK